MSPPQNGTYYITNDALKQAVDLSQGDVSPNTPIIGYTPNEKQDSQKWVVEKDGENCHIRSILSTSAHCATTGGSDGDGVVVGERELFELLEVEAGKYRIKVPDQNLVWRLENGNNGTQINLKPMGLQNTVWHFKLIHTL